MTKEEVMSVIKTKIAWSKKECDDYFNRGNYDSANWYEGIVKGLEQALEVVGMLDNEHNRTNIKQ